MTVFLVILGLILAVFLWQVLVIGRENRFKHRQYEGAEGCARSRGKELLVAGGPWGVKSYRYWLRMPAHGGGDVCLDIDPRAMRDHPCAVVADITRMPFRDKSFGAVFISHVLEHVATTGDAVKALSELSRVADSVFIVYPYRQSLIAWVKREHHLWLWQEENVVFLEPRGKAAGGAVKFTLPT
ncbi:MAG: methyltransferase domain-containing protein [Chloroflexota bacterium]